MAQSRLLMRQIRELLRLHFEEGLSQRLIARAQGVMRCTVERVLKRFASSGLGWPPDPALTDEELERRLYRRSANGGTAKASASARPDYAKAVKELARKGVTRRLLWSEYRELAPDGVGYSVFCPIRPGAKGCPVSRCSAKGCPVSRCSVARRCPVSRVDHDPGCATYQ